MRAQVVEARPEDIGEIAGVYHKLDMPWQHAEAFRRCLRQTSHVWIGKWEGEVVCVWGVMGSTLASGTAYLWLYTTPAIKDCEFTFVRRSQIEMQKLLEHFPVIVGHCEATAERSIRWLRWLGAEFGPEENRFVPFRLVRKDD